MAGDAPSEHKAKHKAKHRANEADQDLKQMNALLDEAPVFFGTELENIYRAIQDEEACTGPIVKDGHISLPDLFKIEQRPRANERLQTPFADAKIGKGELTLHWDDGARPASLTFKGKDGNIEELILDSQNRSRVATDIYRTTDGMVGRFEFDANGQVRRGKVTAGDNVGSFDFDSGFHLSAQTHTRGLRISDDGRSRFIEKSVPTSKLAKMRDSLTSLKYFYENDHGQDDGELEEVVLTYADGSSYSVHRDANGRPVMEPR